MVGETNPGTGAAVTSCPPFVTRSYVGADPLHGFESFPIRIRTTSPVVMRGGRLGGMRTVEEAVFRLLQLVDFDENMSSVLS